MTRRSWQRTASRKGRAVALTRLLSALLPVLPARGRCLPLWRQFVARSPRPARGARGCHSASFDVRLPCAATRAALALWWRCWDVEADSGREALHEVTVAGCLKLEAPEPDHVPSWEQIRHAHRKRVWSARHLEINWETKKSCHAAPLPGAPTTGVRTSRSSTN